MTTRFSDSPTLCFLVLAGIFTGNISLAQQSESNQRIDQQTRQAQAVSLAVYNKIQEAQKAIDEEDEASAYHILTDLNRSEKLTDYERSQVLQYLGFLQHNMGDTKAAIVTFEEIIRIASLEPQFLTQTVLVVAKLNMAVEHYADAIRHLEHWFSLEPNPAAEPFILYSQCLYQAGRYKDMIVPIETAIEISNRRGTEVKEDWYSLLSFSYFQVEDYAKVRDTLKTVLENWPRKRYWTSIAGAYSELGDEQNLVNVYDIAHTQQLLDKEAELVTLAQLYLQRDVPYKAATLLESEIEAGRVSRSEKNYRLLSQAWSFAREVEKSLPALQQASNLSDDGELNVRLGNVYLDLAEYAECVSTIQDGIQKGELKKPDYAHVSLGMCFYNLKKYDAAGAAFSEARKTVRSRRTADEWLRVINIDKRRDEEIKFAEQQAIRRIQLLAERRDADGVR